MRCIVCALIFIRNGRVARQSKFFPAQCRETDKPGELLSAFIVQYYSGAAAAGGNRPRRRIEDAGLAGTGTLSAQAEHKVAIRDKVRGDRSRWLEMARTNAEQGLSLKVASNATIRRQFVALGEALGLDEAPQRIECFDISHTSGEAGHGRLLRSVGTTAGGQ